jgi:hypothetical protein
MGTLKKQDNRKVRVMKATRSLMNIKSDFPMSLHATFLEQITRLEGEKTSEIRVIQSGTSPLGFLVVS